MAKVIDRGRTLNKNTNKQILKIKYNYWFLYVKIISALIKSSPDKLKTLKAIGTFKGWVAFLKNKKKRKRLNDFLKLISANADSNDECLKFFIQEEIDKLWGFLFYEDTDNFKKYIPIKNSDLVKETIMQGRGAILIGAHNGPDLYRYLSHEINPNIKNLTGKGLYDYIQKASALAIKSLISKKVQFLKESGNMLEINKCERELVSHVKNGGVISMHLDFPTPGKNSTITDFLGQKMGMSYFAFKLSLNYNIPIFLYFIEKDPEGEYVYQYTQIKGFSTPEEGAQLYANIVGKKILEYPYLWNLAAEFPAWFNRQ